MKSSSFLYLNDIRLHYIHWNLRDGGRPVILLHGLAYTAHIWDLVAPLLVEKGWMPLAYDQRGHGLSDKPAGEYTFETVTKDLAAFLEMMNLEKPLLVGHSWGGMVVLEYASRITIGPRAPRGIVLVDGGIGQVSDIPDFSWEKMNELMAPAPNEGIPLKRLKQKLLRPKPTWTLTAKALPAMLANYQIDENEIAWPRLDYAHHIQILKTIWNFNSYQRYSLLRCPVLMIPASPKEPLNGFARMRVGFRQRGLEQARTSIPELSIHWMKDTIHDVPLQRPRELAELINDFGQALEA